MCGSIGYPRSDLYFPRFTGSSRSLSFHRQIECASTVQAEFPHKSPPARPSPSKSRRQVGCIYYFLARVMGMDPSTWVRATPPPGTCFQVVTNLTPTKSNASGKFRHQSQRKRVGDGGLRSRDRTNTPDGPAQPGPRQAKARTLTRRDAARLTCVQHALARDERHEIARSRAARAAGGCSTHASRTARTARPHGPNRPAMPESQRPNRARIRARFVCAVAGRWHRRQCGRCWA
jgi:hypothetical protein